MEYSEAPLGFHYEVPSFSLPDEAKTGQWIIDTLEVENTSLIGINIIFVDDEEILRINIEHLDHDYYTDIISFQYQPGLGQGDIFISLDRVRENAASLEVEFNHELHRVIIHGILHFAGYGDKTTKEKSEMRRKEEDYLSIFFQ